MSKESDNSRHCQRLCPSFGAQRNTQLRATVGSAIRSCLCESASCLDDQANYAAPRSARIVKELQKIKSSCV